MHKQKPVEERADFVEFYNQSPRHQESTKSKMGFHKGRENYVVLFKIERLSQKNTHINIVDQMTEEA